jgi:hypothetical protein
MYQEPEGNKYCYSCKFRRYDTFQDEIYCTHNPQDDHVGYTIDNYVCCKYWAISDFYKDE